MLEIRRDEEIYSAEGGWFQARWHFSFDRYRDPEQMGIGPLRVFNDDRIVAGAAWPMHPHRDIESLTYVVEGEFEHSDSLGNDGRLQPGAAQVMTFSHAGAQHSERNGSAQNPMRFLQFWILPSVEGLESSVQQHQYGIEERTDRWLQIMGPADEDGLDLSQEARVLVTHLEPGASVSHRLGEDRGGYLYVIEGVCSVGGVQLHRGDAVKAFGPEQLILEASGSTESILIEVPLKFTPVGVWAGRP